MDGMIAVALIIAIVVPAAVAESFAIDPRDYEPKNAMGDTR